MSLVQLAYISHAAPQLDERDIEQILAQSRRNNANRRITGHLQCHGGIFFQVLEGPDETLDELMVKLRQDPRHTGMNLLFRQAISRRTFANWSMGFGPCSRTPPSPLLRERLLGLIEAKDCSAQQVLGLFFVLMESSAA